MNLSRKNKLGEMSFAVADYHKMMEIGILPENHKTEILEGKLVEIMPVGSRHASIVAKLSKIFERRVGDEVIVWTQNPVKVNEKNEPFPDIALLKLREDFYFKENPKPEDVLLIVEVADSTLKSDRKWKIGLYAEAKIPEVWLINLQNTTIEVHKKPQNSEFSFVKVYRAKEIIESESVPNLEISVDKILD